jgi:DNA (cytosine-5)-methyltransferase 1
MFDVLRFAEHHRYRAMVIENVVDIATNPKFAEAWALWKKGLRTSATTSGSCRSTHARPGARRPGTAVPRPALHRVLAPRRPRPEHRRRPPAARLVPACGEVVEAQQSWKNGRTVGKYRSQYVYLHGSCGTIVEPGYLPAAAAIDWSLRGTRIGDRTKPLADKTRRRIAAGIARYWSPFHMEKGGNQYDAADPKHPSFGDPNAYYRAWSTHDVLRPCTPMESKALVVPLEGRAGDRVKSPPTRCARRPAATSTRSSPDPGTGSGAARPDTPTPVDEPLPR